MSSRCITPALGDRQSGPPLAEAAGHGETETNRRPRRTACRPGLKIQINNVRSTSLFLSRTDRFVTALQNEPGSHGMDQGLQHKAGPRGTDQGPEHRIRGPAGHIRAPWASKAGRRGRRPPQSKNQRRTSHRNSDISVSFFLTQMNIVHLPTFSKIKWPNSEEKLNFGGRWAWVPWLVASGLWLVERLICKFYQKL